MNKELQNLNWQCLPKETRDYIKNTYPIVHYPIGDAMIDLFGEHNLTSDTEPKKVMIIPLQAFCQLCADADDYINEHIMEDSSYEYYQGRSDALHELASYKCLSDEVGAENATPKTWSNLVKSNKVIECGAEIQKIWGNKICENTRRVSSIEKSALALLKIHQLIKVCYGGNVTKQDFDNLKENECLYFIKYDHDKEKFIINACNFMQYNIIMFHTKEQAEEFLSYPENVQLLKDYYMI